MRIQLISLSLWVVLMSVLVIIKIIMLVRANTARNLLPQHSDVLVRHQQKLKERTRQIFSKQSSRPSQRKISTAVLTSTCRTNNFFKPQSQQGLYRDRPSMLANRPETTLLRPLTQQSGRLHRTQTPLSVINTRSKGLSNASTNLCDRTSALKRQFLRKGQSVDRAIIHNVLKSKINKNVCAPTFNYCDQPKNKELVSIIASQIPRGVRDVVGVEQMMRMSHIYTGTQFKNSSLTKKLNSTLSLARACRKDSQIAEEEDAVTLKSIKRW